MPTIVVQCTNLDTIAERLGEALEILIETVVERQEMGNINLLNSQKDAKI